MRSLERFASDPQIGCIVVTGAERGFCAGGDVTAMNAATRPFQGARGAEKRL